MITASPRSPTKNDAQAVTASRISNGDRSCRPSTGNARAPCERTAFGPSARRRRAASAAVRPAPVRCSSRASTPGTASEPAATTPSGAAGHRTGRAGTVGHCQPGTSSHRMSPHWRPAHGHGQGRMSLPG